MLHSSDPSHSQFSRLRAGWHRHRATVALVESRTRSATYGGFDTHVRQHSEVGATVFLAGRDGVSVRSLEPERSVEAAALLARFPARQVALEMTLSTYWADRKSGPVSDADAENILRKRTSLPGLEGALEDVADLDAQWRADFPSLPSWRTHAVDTAPNRHGTYFNEMGRISNRARDDHWLRVMIDLVLKGERVFAVSGASHTIVLEPVLRAELLALGLTEQARP